MTHEEDDSPTPFSEWLGTLAPGALVGFDPVEVYSGFQTGLAGGQERDEESVCWKTGYFAGQKYRGVSS